MPQMAPMWWTLLYMLFLMSFLYIIIMMYFNMKPMMNKEKKLKKIKMKWMW